MLRRSFRIGIRLGLAGGVLFAIVKLVGSRRAAPSASVAPAEPWPPLVADPTPSHTTADVSLQPDPDAPKVSWVEPTGDVCPTSHPVKAKLSSKIFHLPGMLNYDRTKPDRCYSDGAAAEADGLRPAKR